MIDAMIDRAALVALRAAADPFWSYFRSYADEDLPAGAADLRFGNPTELAPDEFVAALQEATVPRSPDWFAYPANLPVARAHVSRLCREDLGLDVDDDGVVMTNGAFGALALTFRALIGPARDEVVVLDPPWFFYDLQAHAAGGHAVHVTMAPPDFAIDPDAVAAAITERTAAVVVNSPHNPSGRVYGPADWTALGAALTAAADRLGRPVPLVSDESYRRIVYDGRVAVSPATAYPHTLVVHTYGKTTLAPGERIGWLAVPRGFPDAEALQEMLTLLQVATGWSFPDAVLQRSLPVLERVSIDVGVLQRRRDHLVDALRGGGYEVVRPEGTFYVLVRSPDPDDVTYCRALGARSVYVLPGSVFRLPGWFRVSLTATDAMVEQAVAALLDR